MNGWYVSHTVLYALKFFLCLESKFQYIINCDFHFITICLEYGFPNFDNCQLQLLLNFFIHLYMLEPISDLQQINLENLFGYDHEKEDLMEMQTVDLK